MANLRDIFKRRQGLNAITGFNGGSLQDQLDEDAVDTPPSTRPRMVNPRAPEPAQTNEFAAPSIRDRQVVPQAMPDVVSVDETQQPTPLRNLMTRPRSTNPFLDRMASDPSRQERPREVNPTDEVTKSADYVRQIQDKPLSLRDKFGLVAQNIATNLGATPLATRRQRDLARAGEGLQRDLAVDKQSILREQGQMVPFQLPDGTWTQVPAKTVGSLGSRQQTQQASLSLRRQQVEDHRKRWGQMGSHEAIQDAQRLYNSGAADDNDDLKDAIATQMGLPAGAKLPNHDRGQLIIGDDGNYRLASPKTGAAIGVTDKTTGNPVRAWTAEQFKQSQAQRAQLARERMAQSQTNATIVAGGQVARMGDPVVFQKNVDEITKNITDIDDEIKVLTAKQQSEGLTRDEAATLKGLPREKQGLERERRQEQVKLGQVTSAQGNQATRTSGGTSRQAATPSATSGSFNLGGWKAAHPNASSQEIQAMRAKAKARNLAIVE